MLMKLIFPYFAFCASVVDFLGAEKPVVIIDEFEVQGNHLEAFLDLHHSIRGVHFDKKSIAKAKIFFGSKSEAKAKRTLFNFLRSEAKRIRFAFAIFAIKRK